MKEARLNSTTIKEVQDLKSWEGMILSSVNGSDRTGETVLGFREAPKQLLTEDEQKKVLDFAVSTRLKNIPESDFGGDVFDDIADRILKQAIKLTEGLEETPQG